MFNSKTTKTEEMTTQSIKPMNTNSNSGPILNIIGAGTSIEGALKCDGDIRIDGHVKGTVTSKAKIVVGPTGAIEGDLYCETADVSGKVFGSIEVEDMLFLKSSAYMEG